MNKLPITNFQGALLGAVGLVAFGSKAFKKKPALKEIPGLLFEAGAAAKPLFTVEWDQVLKEGFDIDSEENKLVMDKLNVLLSDFESAKTKNIILGVAKAIQPGVAFVMSAKELYETFKKPAAPAVAAPAAPKKA